MYLLGIVLLALGIMGLVPAGIMVWVAITQDQSVGLVVGGLVCFGLVCIPMMAGGIALIQRAEARNPPPAELYEPVPGETWLDRMRRFDLSRLNWVGWLLFLSTFAFVFVEAAVLTALLPAGPNAPRMPRLIALPLLLLAVGFFVAVRWLLGTCGISIYRR